MKRIGILLFALCLIGVLGCQNETREGDSDELWVERLSRGLEEKPTLADLTNSEAIKKAFVADPPTASNLHQLIKDRYPETVSLPDLVRKMSTSAEGRELLAKMMETLQNVADVQIDPSQMEQVIEHPELILDLLQFTPDQLAAARNIASQLLAGIADLQRPDVPLPSILKNEFYLPQFFDYDAADETVYEVSEGELIPVIEGVYVGVLRDPMYTQEELRRNFMLAEVLERLGLNATATEEDIFTVAYDNQTFTRLSDFLQALLNDGHEMKAMVRHYVAPFFPVYAADENNNLKPVAAATFLRTGIKDSEGIEAALPLFHSEFVFSIMSTERTTGKGINASVQFYQGIPKTGFYGEGNMDRPLWLGEVISDDSFSSEQAAAAMLLSGYLVDVTRGVAEERQLPFDGWGVNGVCNDSAAVIQQAIHKKISSYPLFMPDTLMVEALTTRIEDSFYRSNSYLDFLVYWILRQAILETPEDIQPTPDSLVRLLSSFPWEPGDEPFYSVVDARRIIDEYARSLAPTSADIDQ